VFSAGRDSTDPANGFLTAFSGFASAETRDIPALNPRVPAELRDFPQFFPQVWKTLGRDQTRMETLRPEQA
jgi:hypothetical protein